MTEPTQEQPQENPNGEFHTHSNLTQALTNITAEHFKSSHKDAEGNPVVMPGFMAEAVHMAFSHIAAAANGNPFFVPHWQNASAYCQVVANILLQAEKELAEKELAEKAEAEKAEAEKAEAEKAEAEKAAAEDSEGEPTFEPVDEPMTQG
jgi:hypothetical protein